MFAFWLLFVYIFSCLLPSLMQKSQGCSLRSQCDKMWVFELFSNNMKRFSTMIRSIPFIRREEVLLYLKSSSHHGENECILMYFRPFSLLSSVESHKGRSSSSNSSIRTSVHCIQGRQGGKPLKDLMLMIFCIWMYFLTLKNTHSKFIRALLCFTRA